MTRRVITLLIAASTLTACAPAGLGPALLAPVAVDYVRGLEPGRYLSTALDAMQQNSYYSDRLDWPSLRRQATAAAAGARLPGDTYTAIQGAVDRLHAIDNHSQFLPPRALPALSGLNTRLPGAGVVVLTQNGTVVLVYPGSPAERVGIRLGDVIESIDGQSPRSRVPDAELYGVFGPGPFKVAFSHPGAAATEVALKAADIDINVPPAGRRLGRAGYLQVTSVLDLNPFDTSYAARLDGLVQANDQVPACGWIVDLRQNSGGTVGLMAGGLGALLGSDPYGYVVSRGSRMPFTAEPASSYRLKSHDPPVAVLTSPVTGSSGELVAIAFRGRPQWRSFGEPSGGLTSSTHLTLLNDGAVLVVMDAIDADRSGRLYGGKLEPDQPVAVDWTRYGTADDPVLGAALQWLKSQPACA